MKGAHFIFGCMVILTGCFFACDNGTISSQESPTQESPAQESPTQESPTPEAQKYPSTMWGEWIGISSTGGVSTTPWYITSTNIKATFPGGTSSDITNRVEISTSGSNVLEATVETSNPEYTFWRLYPQRTATATFSGTIALLSPDIQAAVNHGSASVSRSMSGVGGVGVVGNNLKDAAQRKKTKTDSNGNFLIDGVIPGDQYEVTVDGENVKVTVTPDADGDNNIGTIAITEGLNFKASIEPLSTKPSSNIMLANSTKYERTIIITNIGSETAAACNYTITGESGESVDNGIVGSIAPGKNKKISISVSCAPVAVEKRFKKYNVVVNDPINKKTWNDSVSLLFYKSDISLTIMSEDVKGSMDDVHMHIPVQVQGVIISPERISYPFETGNMGINRTIKVPRLKGKYIIAIAAAAAETIYAIDMSVFSTHLTESDFWSQISGFTGTGSYEPNNSEAAAKNISQPIISYLHAGDVDYYSVNINS